jgi:predicted nucleic acid-binding protein
VRHLADTSAWIDFIAATGSVVDHAVTSGPEGDRPATTDAVVMEVLAGAGTQERAPTLRSLIGRAEFLALIDCLIAAVAIRRGVPVLHRDEVFEVIGKHSPLKPVHQ